MQRRRGGGEKKSKKKRIGKKTGIRGNKRED